ncbi:MAG: polysaccharide deacetylase family protein [Candidatus Eremiobacterota bacterium]
MAEIHHGISFYDTFPGKIALTFDDGPDPNITPHILDILKEHNIKATFFVKGKNVTEYPEIIKRIVGEGHSIGNHTYNHINMKKSNQDTILKELAMTEKAVNNALGYDYEIKYIRPPWGEYNDSAEQLIYDSHKELILWQIDSEDWRNIGKSWIIDRFNYESLKGGVAAFHDTCMDTPEALREIIRENKLNFLAVDELISEKYSRKNTTSTYFNHKPAENNIILINDTGLMSLSFFSEETGINFIHDYNKKELIFAGIIYRYSVTGKEAFIPLEYLVKDFSLKMIRNDKNINFYYPLIFVNDISFYKKSFIYKNYIYIPAKDIEETGIILKEEAKPVESAGILYKPVRSLHDIKEHTENIIDISLP